MRKFLFIMLAACLTLYSSESLASFVQNLDNTRFLLMDSGGDSSVTLNIDHFFGEPTDLSYSLGDSWASYDNSGEITVADVAPERLIFFKYSEDTSAELTFSGLFDVREGVQAYRSVLLDWGEGGFEVTFGTADHPDGVAPVPLPSAAFLLIPGLLGLIGLQRKKG